MNEPGNPLSPERLSMARETVEAIEARVRGVNNTFAESCHGHQFSGDHLSEEYHEALCRLGSRLKRLALEQPDKVGRTP